MFDAPVQAMMMLNKTMTRLLTQSPFASTLAALVARSTYFSLLFVYTDIDTT